MARGFGFQWHITNECDQKCKHCYIYGKNPSVLPSYLNVSSLSYILENIIGFCASMNVFPYIYLTGGDPLLHPDIWELLSLFRQKNIRFSILGNPYHLNPDVCNKLKLFGCEKYQMSVDGLEKTHDKIRKKGSFRCTIEKYKVLKEAGIRTAMMSTVCRENADEIKDLVRLAVENRIDNFGYARYCPSGNTSIDMLTPHEYRCFLNELWSVFVKYKNSNTIISLKDHLWIPFLDEIGVICIPPNTNKQILDGCNCAISHMTIVDNGDVYACRRFDSIIGNALRQDLYYIFNDKPMNYYRDYSKFIACNNCKYLYLCRGCPAVSACTYGNFYAPDPQCWVYEERSNLYGGKQSF